MSILEVHGRLSSVRLARGKTSLLETVAGLREPERAKISLDGQLFQNTKENYSLPIRLRKIGYVPQDDSLFPHLWSDAISFTGATAHETTRPYLSSMLRASWKSDHYSIATLVPCHVEKISAS